MSERDPLIEQLAVRDPVRVDRAPEPGSTRRVEILDRAMRTLPAATDRSDVRPSTRPLSTRSGHGASTRGRRAVFVLGAAAAILAIVMGFVLLDPNPPGSPAAALIRAAENTGDALTLRSDYIRDDGDGRFSVVRSEHHGGDVRRTFSVIEPGGTERTDVDSDEFIIYIGDKGWTAADGPDEPTIVKPEERNAPYAESSAAIVEAAVTESIVTEIGVEDVRDVEATHYRIKLDDAAIGRLGRLRRNQLSAFELENASQVRSLDLWIADGYIRRIRVTQTWEAPDSLGTTVEFYDFGADITITPPT